MIDLLHDYWRSTPFVPFDIHLTDGRKMNVPHPDFFWMSPRGGTIIVSDQDDKTHLVNLLTITTVSKDSEPAPLVSSETAAR